MGRPRKYHTEEEQRNAHRLRNQKHYHSKKQRISDKRRLDREAKRTSEPPRERRVVGRRGTPLSLARALFKQCQDKVKIINGGRSLLEILNGVCVEVRDLSGGDPAKIEEIVEGHWDALTRSGVVSDLNRCHHEVLNLVGCGKELSEIRKVIDDVGGLARGLDCIYADSCLDYEDFLNLFKQGRLDFQR